MADNTDLALYRFALEDLYRQQEHVLDEKGEHLLSLSSRFSSSPYDAYAALSTADIKHPTIKLSTGPEITLTYGQYRAILATNRSQSDRAASFREYHKLYEANVNTYASLYNGVLQRDWFQAQSREYRSTLESALHAFESDDVLREALGKDFGDYYATSRRWELKAWRETVTGWERARYDRSV